MAASETYDIVINQGAKWDLEVLYEDSNGDPIDLTGASARMQIRKQVDDASFEEELTDGGGEITITPAQGKLLLELTDSETSALDFKTGVYDLELVKADTTVERILEGKVTVSPEVTR